MTPDIYQDVTVQLTRSPQSLSQLHELIQELGSDWSVDQLQLFLTCMAGVDLTAEGQVRLGAKSPQEALLEAVVNVVKSRGGKPIPAAQVLRLLPGQFTTSEAQIKALVKTSRELELFGPGLLRLK
ncbi:hypothetical protein [Lyngbya confervoides]|uniref:Uncharacterized protein n=1 Tax=Lyngbya confervoides BDU141951 TaxID=1574623 RepID=A0ABD4T8D0_9CYAN|nr:hypothetical protein [Lyngbya confervoides]MCM1984765.1 hypothetical protein [Lyngbya confervoides BDU141951]